MADNNFMEAILNESPYASLRFNTINTPYSNRGDLEISIERLKLTEPNKHLLETYSRAINYFTNSIHKVKQYLKGDK